MIEAITWRRFRPYHVPADGDNLCVGIFSAYPIRGGIHVSLDENFQALWFGEFEEYVDHVELVSAFARLARRPIHPAPDGVESHRFDFAQIAPPDLFLGPRPRLQHRRTG